MTQETLEESAEKYADFSNDYVPMSFGDKFNETTKRDFIEGAKWMQERMYSEEDMYKFANFCRTYDEDCLLKNTIDVKNTLELLEQFKKEDKQ